MYVLLSIAWQSWNMKSNVHKLLNLLNQNSSAADQRRHPTTADNLRPAVAFTHRRFRFVTPTLRKSWGWNVSVQQHSVMIKLKGQSAAKYKKNNLFLCGAVYRLLWCEFWSDQLFRCLSSLHRTAAGCQWHIWTTSFQNPVLVIQDNPQTFIK